MPEQLHYTCPICPLGHALEYDEDCDDYICQGCLLSAPGPVLARIAEGQQARGAVIALEAQLEAAREAIEPGRLAASDGYVHVAIQRLDAARAEAVARANELPGLTAELEELRHQRVDLAVQLRAMVANWDETGEELGFCRSDVLALADAFDRREVASMLDYERAGYMRGREGIVRRVRALMNTGSYLSFEQLDRALRGTDA